MKKSIVFFLITFFCLNASSQNFALKSGLSISNLSSSEVNIESDPRIGIIFGFVSQTGEENIKYSYGLLFNQKGSNQLKFNAIDLQAKANFFFNDEISLNIGPSISYLVSGEYENTNGTFQKIDDWEGYNNRIDYNACFGLSYKINDLLNVDFSYYMGITSILSESDLKTSSSIISVSYLFDY
tara:strand:- start:570 stop:1118 length:549 start_codon:yes stop_codon:yes gene_type:complete